MQRTRKPTENIRRIARKKRKTVEENSGIENISEKGVSQQNWFHWKN